MAHSTINAHSTLMEVTVIEDYKMYIHYVAADTSVSSFGLNTTLNHK